MTVDLFIPCFVDQVSPKVAWDTVKILEKLGITVNYNTDQTCCGQMAFNSGYWDEAKEMGEKFIKNFSNDRYVISPSASCVGMVRNYYSELFHNTALHNECKQLQKNIFELTDFLVNVKKVTDFNATFNEVVTFHDSCAALREYGIKDEPRALLSKVKGLELIEMNESENCCGFGGTFSVKHEAISTAMGEQKVKNAVDSGASYIVSTESSCLMHLDGYIKKTNAPIKAIHVAEIIASGW